MNLKTIVLLMVAVCVGALTLAFGGNFIGTVLPHYCETAKTSFKYSYREFYVRDNFDRTTRLASELNKMNEVCRQPHGDTSSLDFEVDPAIVNAARKN